MKTTRKRQDGGTVHLCRNEKILFLSETDDKDLILTYQITLIDKITNSFQVHFKKRVVIFLVAKKRTI